MKQELLKKEIEILHGIDINASGNTISIKGPRGELIKSFVNPDVKTEINNGKIVLHANNATKREKRMIGTFSAHLKNMMKGVTKGFIYKLKICSGHFPMNVSVEGKDVVIKNFLGERHPRRSKIMDGAKVNVQGDIITVEGIDKDVVSQSASNIELACRISNRDRRILMDGIWIIRKDEKAIR